MALTSALARGLSLALSAAAPAGLTNDTIRNEVSSVPWSSYVLPTMVVVLAAVLLGLMLLRRSRR